MFGVVFLVAQLYWLHNCIERVVSERSLNTLSKLCEFTDKYHNSNKLQQHMAMQGN